ncbi:Uncharacterised protein [Shigella sonnei]|nr:Uncharacterised protein [Shigella sonnei]
MLPRRRFVFRKINRRLSHKRIILRQNAVGLNFWQPQFFKEHFGTMNKRVVATAKLAGNTQRLLDVVIRHIAGEGVIIDMFGIFVRPNNIMNFQTVVNPHRAANPELCSFQK